MVYTVVTVACLLAHSVGSVAPPAPQQVERRPVGGPARTPDDYELFLENILEAPRGQRKVWNGKVYNAPYKGDPIKGVPAVVCPGGVCPLVPAPRPAPK